MHFAPPDLSVGRTRGRPASSGTAGPRRLTWLAHTLQENRCSTTSYSELATMRRAKRSSIGADGHNIEVVCHEPEA